MSASSPNVIVLLSNAAYSRNCLMTIRGCRRAGNYTGDIVVLVDDEMPDDFLEEAEQFGAIIRHYDPIDKNRFFPRSENTLSHVRMEES